MKSTSIYHIIIYLLIILSACSKQEKETKKSDKPTEEIISIPKELLTRNLTDKLPKSPIVLGSVIQTKSGNTLQIREYSPEFDTIRYSKSIEFKFDKGFPCSKNLYASSSLYVDIEDKNAYVMICSPEGDDITGSTYTKLFKVDLKNATKSLLHKFDNKKVSFWGFTDKTYQSIIYLEKLKKGQANYYILNLETKVSKKVLHIPYFHEGREMITKDQSLEIRDTEYNYNTNKGSVQKRVFQNDNLESTTMVNFPGYSSINSPFTIHLIRGVITVYYQRKPYKSAPFEFSNFLTHWLSESTFIAITKSKIQLFDLDLNTKAILYMENPTILGVLNHSILIKGKNSKYYMVDKNLTKKMEIKGIDKNERILFLDNR